MLPAAALVVPIVMKIDEAGDIEESLEISAGSPEWSASKSIMTSLKSTLGEEGGDGCGRRAKEYTVL